MTRQYHLGPPVPSLLRSPPAICLLWLFWLASSASASASSASSSAWALFNLHLVSARLLLSFFLSSSSLLTLFCAVLPACDVSDRLDAQSFIQSSPQKPSSPAGQLRPPARPHAFHDGLRAIAKAAPPILETTQAAAQLPPAVLLVFFQPALLPQQPHLAMVRQEEALLDLAAAPSLRSRLPALLLRQRARARPGPRERPLPHTLE